MRLLDAESVREDLGSLLETEPLAFGVAEHDEDVAHHHEAEVEAVGTRRTEAVELGEVRDGDDEVGHPACGRGDGTSSSADLEGEVLGLVPHNVGVGEAEGDDEADDRAEDRADELHVIVVACDEDAVGRLGEVCGLAYFQSAWLRNSQLKETSAHTSATIMNGTKMSMRRRRPTRSTTDMPMNWSQSESLKQGGTYAEEAVEARGDQATSGAVLDAEQAKDGARVVEAAVSDALVWGDTKSRTEC